MFKVGDRVRCINRAYERAFYKVGTVNHVDSYGWKITWDDSSINGFPWTSYWTHSTHVRCFELMIPTPEEIDRKAREEYADKYL